MKQTPQDLFLDPEFLSIYKPFVQDDLKYNLIINNTNPLFKEILKMADEDKEITGLFNTCKFKISSMKYHFGRMIEEETNYSEVVKKILEIVNKKGYSFERGSISVNKVDFEFESFILKAKSLMEVFAQLIGVKFKNTCHKFSKLKNILNDFIDKDVRVKLILERINNAAWIEEFETTEAHSTLRDNIAHLKQLPRIGHKVILENEKYKTINSGVIHKEEELTYQDYAYNLLLEIEKFSTDILQYIYDIK